MATFNLRLFVLLSALVAGGSFMLPAFPAEAVDLQIAVIAFKGTHLPEIDSNILRSIYLKKIFLDPKGHAYIPVNLTSADKLRRIFVRGIIHMDELQLENYWNRQYFQGISPPYVLGSQTAVVEFVAKTPGAIGYVQPCYVTPQVDVVLLLTLKASPSTGMLENC